MKPLNIIIVEDEIRATNNLKYLLERMKQTFHIQATLTSIEDTTAWLIQNPTPDLGFFDIQLEDGLSFQIFQDTPVNFPVIFTTAFDQYAIKAFKVNSIDYLLKPIQEEELQESLHKYETLNQAHFDKNTIEKVLSSMQGVTKTSPSFLVHYKEKLIPISSEEIAFFYIENGVVYGRSLQNQNYPIEHTMEELEVMLDEHLFFRANRQYIVHKKAIKDLELYFNGRLSVNMIPKTPELVLISKARVPVFKSWIKQNLP